MSRHETAEARAGEARNRWELRCMPCCGGDIDSDVKKEMMMSGPCARWFGRHRFAVFAFFTTAILAFLVLQVGWLLGVIAFFRTI